MDNYNNTQDTKVNSFSIASMICGFISITMCCTGVFSLPLGALGILFALLTKRLGKPMPPHSMTGVLLSCIGIILGIITLAYVFYLLITDPQYRELFDSTYEYYNNYYNYSSGNL